MRCQSMIALSQYLSAESKQPSRQFWWNDVSTICSWLPTKLFQILRVHFITKIPTPFQTIAKRLDSVGYFATFRARSVEKNVLTMKSSKEQCHVPWNVRWSHRVNSLTAPIIGANSLKTCCRRENASPHSRGRAMRELSEESNFLQRFLPLPPVFEPPLESLPFCPLAGE